MAFGHTTLPTRIWTFGCKGNPVIHIDDVEAQIAKSRDYWNELAKAENDRRKAVADITREYFPELLAAETQIALIHAEQYDIRNEIKRTNSELRKRTKGTPEQQQRLKQLKVDAANLKPTLDAQRLRAYGPEPVKILRKELTALRSDKSRANKARKAELIPQKEQELAAAEAAWFAEIPTAQILTAEVRKINAAYKVLLKKLRGAASDNGLYWGTYLSVEDSMKNAKKDMLHNPRFKRKSLDGRVVLQLQKKKGDKVTTTADIFKQNNRWLRVEHVSDETYLLHLRIGSVNRQPVFTTVPIRIHRPLPEGAAIKWAYLRKVATGTRVRWSVQLVLAKTSWDRPDQAKKGRVGIDVGWRRKENGVRIAYWYGDDGKEGELVLSHEHVQVWEKVKSLQKYCSEHFDLILALLVAWLKDKELPTELINQFRNYKEWQAGHTLNSAEFLARLRRWKSNPRLREFIEKWKDHRIPGDAELHPRAREVFEAMHMSEDHYGTPLSVFDLCVAWAKKDVHLYNWAEHARTKAIRRRNDEYRKFAAFIRRNYRIAGMEKLKIGKMKRRPNPEHDAIPDSVKRRREIAAVATLRRYVQEGASIFQLIEPAYTTQIHAGCGQFSGESNPELLYHVCQHCGEKFDQDRNAAINLLNATTEVPG